MRSFVLTPAAGKRLIARGIAQHPEVRGALASGTVVVVAGTTNGLVAEELLGTAGAACDLPRGRFFRGITLPPSRPAPGGEGFPGDVVLVKGEWRRGATLYDVVGDLREGDVILKGANALDFAQRRAAVLVAHPQGGTVGAAAQVAVGRRVRLILPVGLEKRVPGDLDALAAWTNAPGSQGPCLWIAPGEAYTEIEALEQLTGAIAEPIAAGGVGGAEGCVWLGIDGDPAAVAAAERVLREVLDEPPFSPAGDRAGEGGA